MIISDQLNRTIALKKTPKRIVSLVPSLTELLVDMGLQDTIVGVTKFCVHPQNIKKTAAVVGGTKQVKFDKILALNPDIVICNKEENTQAMVSTLETIAPVWISDIYTMHDNFDMIWRLGKLFNTVDKAEVIIEDINNNMQTFIKTAPKTTKKAAYLIWKNPYMVAGQNTFINTLLTLNNFENFITDKYSRYPEIIIDNLNAVDVILLSSEPFPFTEKDVKQLKVMYPNSEVKLVDGEMFSWYGSRLIKAFKYFSTLYVSS